MPTGDFASTPVGPQQANTPALGGSIGGFNGDAREVTP